MPPLIPLRDWDILERLRYEFDAVGFYLSAHPLDTKAGQLRKQNIVCFTDVQEALARKTSSRLQMAGILIRKQERVSAKSGNKFAFLQLSDSTGVYEVMIFSDTLARTRHFLEPGTGLLVTVDAEIKEEQVRLTGQMIEPLDSALAGKLREVHVHLDAPAPAAKLKEMLQIEGRGAVRVTLLAHIPGGEVAEIPVPGSWTLSPAAIAAIRQSPGIVDIKEF